MATYFLGDVHGCADELEAMLRALEAGPDDAVYLAGDAFDRGPDPVGVWDLIHERGLRSVMSNHEWHLLQVLRVHRDTGDWPETEPYIHDCLDAFRGRRDALEQFLEALPLYRREEGRWILVHAGIHPREGLEGTTHEMALNMRRWPMREDGAPLWFREYTGEELVVFGHNARKEAVVHRVDGEVKAVGLDTGCVYGGKLSAWCLEEERLVQVPAARDYRRG